MDQDRALEDDPCMLSWAFPELGVRIVSSVGLGELRASLTRTLDRNSTPVSIHVYGVVCTSVREEGLKCGGQQELWLLS